MSRNVKRYTNCNKIVSNDKITKIALYMRLSKEDLGKEDESKSINNQRKIIMNFIDKNITLKNSEIIEYIDDGVTGTTQNRIQFQKLLDDINQRKIQTVIVKDFSRFGRDYISLAEYLENIFPFLGIRFIAVNNLYDSSEKRNCSLELSDQFTTLYDDFISKETSQKVKKAISELKGQGKCKMGHPPYGYMKDPDDKNKIIIDELVVENVVKIYKMFLEGNSYMDIARFFNEKNVPSPGKRKNEILNKSYKVYSDNLNIWRSGSIMNILKNEMYTGTFIFNKMEETIIGEKQIKRFPRNDWKRIYSHHEEIISYEIFENVQDLIAEKLERRKSKSFIKNSKILLLKSKVICERCNTNILVKYSYDNKAYLRCSKCYKKSRRTQKINVNDLEVEVLKQVNNHITKIPIDDKMIIKVNNLENKLLLIDDDYKLDRISDDQYQTLKMKYNNKLMKLKSETVYHNEIKNLNSQLVEKYIYKVKIDFLDSYVEVDLNLY